MADEQRPTKKMFYLPSWGKERIQVREVLKETKEYITHMGDYWGTPRERRERKAGRFFDTWEQAHAKLLDDAERDVRYKEEALRRAKSALGQIRSMRPPDETGDGR